MPVKDEKLYSIIGAVTWVLEGGYFFKAEACTAVVMGVVVEVFMIREVGIIHTSVAVIQGGPPGYFARVSITTPIVSALKNYYI